MTIVRIQIFVVLACALSAGSLATMAIDRLAWGQMGHAAFNLALATVNLLVSITFAIALSRAMPAR
jgi:site-specific recombinase